MKLDNGPIRKSLILSLIFVVMMRVALAVKLISIREIAEVAHVDQFVWMYGMNGTWTPFPDSVSSTIENAFRYDPEEIVIDGIYRNNFKCLTPDGIDDRFEDGDGLSIRSLQATKPPATLNINVRNDFPSYED